MKHARTGSPCPGARGFTRGLAAALAALTLLVLASCASDPRKGYTFASSFPEGVRTVQVPVFENYTFDVGLESELTEAIIKELQRTSGIKVAQGSGADSTLKGAITKSELRRLTLDRSTGLVQEVALTIIIDFDWKDNRSGEILASRRNYAASDTFVPSRPTAERIDAGRHAAVQRMARDLVAELRSGW
ncbi:hypothetical protein PHYC_01711 [Phycisphaerales bacterium]|nr:hypothetical protein PHYC_01711 [Phycisphaerales bacterium]